MIECSVDNLNDINYFLELMNQKKLDELTFNNSLTKYVIIKDIAFIAYSIYYDRAEIDYIYVCDNYRKRGYASKLLEFVINKVNTLDNITLEVNVTNIKAIRLYEKYGFKIATKREKYYGKDDAYLMIRKMM